MSEDQVWIELRSVTNRVVALRRQRAVATAAGDHGENQRLSVEIVRAGFSRDQMLAELSKRFAA